MRYFVLVVLAAVIGGCHSHGPSMSIWEEKFSRPADAPAEVALAAEDHVSVVRVPPNTPHREHVASTNTDVEYLGETQFYNDSEADPANEELSEFARKIGADTVGLTSVLQSQVVDAGRTYWLGAAWSKTQSTYSVTATYWRKLSAK